MRHVRGHAGRGEQHVLVPVFHGGDLGPFLLGQLVAESGFHGVRFLIILERQGVRSRAGHLQATGHHRLLAHFEMDRRREPSEGRRVVPVGGTGFDVQDLLEERVLRLQRTVGTAHRLDFRIGFRQETVGKAGNLRIEHRIHRSQRGVLLHIDVGHREHPGGEGASRGEGALDGIGIETDSARFRNPVLGEEAFTHEPFPEELAHLHLQRAAAERQLAGGGAPVEPLVRRDPRQHGTRAAQRRPDVVPAQDDHFLPGVALGEALRARHECRAFGGCAPGREPRAAGNDCQDRHQQR